jgi:hypothetical protein
MTLSEYFENIEGTGVLATADSDGNVDVAIYAKPHVIEEDTVAFIMSERLSYQNVTSNPKAAYLFMEDTGGYKGKRLYLTKTKEDSDKEIIDSIRRRCATKCDDSEENKHLVYFEVDKTRELIGE